MTWCRLDDEMDENRKLRRLSHEAFRLYWTAVSYTRRHETSGRLLADDVAELCARHRIRNPKTAIAELLHVPTEYGYDAGCWEELQPGVYEIHDHEEYNPATSKERMRRKRAREREDAARADPVRDAPVTSQVVTTAVTSDAPVTPPVSGCDTPRAQPRAGYLDPVPEPRPVPGPPAPNGASETVSDRKPPDSMPAPGAPPEAKADPRTALGDRLVAELGSLMAGGMLSPADQKRVQNWPWAYQHLARLGERAFLEPCRRRAGQATARGDPIRQAKFFEAMLGELDAAIVDDQSVPSGRSHVNGLTRLGDMLATAPRTLQ